MDYPVLSMCQALRSVGLEDAVLRFTRGRARGPEGKQYRDPFFYRGHSWLSQRIVDDNASLTEIIHQFSLHF